MAHLGGAMMANSAIYRYTAYTAERSFAPTLPLAIAAGRITAAVAMTGRGVS
jgi:hypothetical protein